MKAVYINTITKEWTCNLEKAKSWQAKGARVVWCYRNELKETLARI